MKYRSQKILYRGTWLLLLLVNIVIVCQWSISLFGGGVNWLISISGMFLGILFLLAMAAISFYKFDRPWAWESPEPSWQACRVDLIKSGILFAVMMLNFLVL